MVKLRMLVVRYRRLLSWLAVILVILGSIGWFWGKQPDRRLFALDKATGQNLWTVSLPAVRRPLVPATANHRVFVGYVSSTQDLDSDYYTVAEFHVAAFDSGSGQSLWDFKPDMKTYRSVRNEDWLGDALAAIDDGVYLYFGGTDDQNHTQYSLIALDATTGKQQWILPNVAIDFEIQPLVQRVGDHLFVLGRGTTGFQLLMLNSQTGKILQTIDIDDGFIQAPGSPTLLSNSHAVYLFIRGRSGGHSVTAYDPGTGKELFSLDASLRAIWCDDTNLYVLQDLETVKAYDGLSGAERWTYDPQKLGTWHCKFLANMSGGQGTVLVQAVNEGDIGHPDEASLLALDPHDGHLRWERPFANFNADYFILPTASGDQVLAIGGTVNRGGVMALSSADGSEQWNFQTHGVDNAGDFYSPIVHSPVTDGERVYSINYVTRLSGVLLAINPNWH